MRILIGAPVQTVFESDNLGFQVLQPTGPHGARGVLTGDEAELLSFRSALGPLTLIQVFHIEHEGISYSGCSLYSTAGWTVEYMQEMPCAKER